MNVAGSGGSSAAAKQMAAIRREISQSEVRGPELADRNREANDAWRGARTTGKQGMRPAPK